MKVLQGHCKQRLSFVSITATTTHGKDVASSLRYRITSPRYSSRGYKYTVMTNWRNTSPTIVINILACPSTTTLASVPLLLYFCLEAVFQIVTSDLALLFSKMTNWSRSFAQLIEAKMRRIELFSYPVILRLENNPNAVIAMQRFSIVETTAWKNFCDWRLPESRLLGVVLVLEKKKKCASDCFHGIWKLARKRWRLGVTAPQGNGFY